MKTITVEQSLTDMKGFYGIEAAAKRARQIGSKYEGTENVFTAAKENAKTETDKAEVQELTNMYKIAGMLADQSFESFKAGNANLTDSTSEATNFQYTQNLIVILLADYAERL